MSERVVGRPELAMPAEEAVWEAVRERVTIVLRQGAR
jgi:hypothetical protein